jgi:hypothetical protein
MVIQHITLQEAVRISPVELLAGLDKLGALQINNR